MLDLKKNIKVKTPCVRKWDLTRIPTFFYYCFMRVRAFVDMKYQKNMRLKVYLSFRQQKSVAFAAIV